MTQTLPTSNFDGTSWSAYVPWQSLPVPNGIVDRRSFLPQRAARKRVVHLGCADERLTQARAGTGALLHEELARVSSSLVGVDISETAVTTMRALVPGRYVVGDVERLGDLELPMECDLVIAAELIEHLGRPHDFLCGLRDYLTRSGANAIVTTPNAYSWTHFVRFAARRREWVHPDHRSLYSPITLRHAFELADLDVRAMWVHAWERTASRRTSGTAIADRAALRVNPWLGVGLIFEVRAR